MALPRKHRLIALMLGCLLSLTSLAREPVRVVIESRILEPDPQAGVKVRHLLEVDFDRQNIEDFYETGTTDFFGVDLDSVRDNFTVLKIHFSGDVAWFEVRGETASGVAVLPNVNYRLNFEVARSGEAKISGCHDGYPAYRIVVDGVEQYAYQHQPLDLLSLLGECDIVMQD